MKKVFYSILLLLSTTVNAETFMATGIGDTANEARTNAVTNAIKSSLGEFIYSKEELNNETFNQKILNHSNGYVEKVDVLSQRKKSNGEYQVDVSVEITSQKLIERIKEAQGDRLKGAKNEELLSELTKLEVNKNNDNSYNGLVNELLLLPIENNLAIADVKIAGKLKPISSNEDSGEILVSLPLKITVSKDYSESWKKLAIQAKSNNSRSVIRQYDIKKGIYKQTYSIDEKKHRELKELLVKSFENQCYGISLSLLDSNDDEFKHFTFTRRDYEHVPYIKEELKYTDSDKFFSVRDILPHRPTGEMQGDIAYASGTANIQAIFPITKEDIEELSDIKVTIDFIRDNTKPCVQF